VPRHPARELRLQDGLLVEGSGHPADPSSPRRLRLAYIGAKFGSATITS
jgi:hypothetical protein